MIYEMTYQIRVTDFEKGLHWYKTLLNKEPDFTPHEGFAEWEIIPGAWLQVSEGSPSEGSGPMRLGVRSIEDERVRLMSELDVEFFEIFAREEVPVKWATFSDPWGNQFGFFEYVKEAEMHDRVASILGKKK
ncbi:VOC family protein [Mesobacillus jeotgali]|uniref:VOC family protein n=1 Tax=Mesobacillus jeotgali TaxID=129985 RepID=UPI0009A879A7|nr:VOC family protein [Mesobacillus jeotgali]